MSRQKINVRKRRASQVDDDAALLPRSTGPLPAKLTTADLRDLPPSAHEGTPPSKLTVEDVGQEGMTPTESLRYCDWILSSERGWAERRVDRRAEPGRTELDDDGAMASAFEFLADARGGAQLPTELRARLEAALGVDLSRVRVHTDAAAAQAALALSARAFTIGEDIYFAAGAYDPSGGDGVELIAHECAHVAENQRGTGSNARAVSRPDDPHEQRADAFARGFTARQSRLETTDPAEAVNFMRREARRAELPFRAELEEHFGTSLDFVETYTGEAALMACRLMSAGAFVIRNVVALADPSPQRDTLMHELTHVMQRGDALAPEVFERGSLSLGVRGSAVEEEAEGHRAQPGERADANTIHRETTPPDPAKAQDRVKEYCAKLAKALDAPDKGKLRWGAPEGAHCNTRYYWASSMPFTSKQYVDASKGDKKDLDAALADGGFAADLGDGVRLHRAGNGYIISKKDPGYANDDYKATATRVTIEEKDKWQNYVDALGKIGQKGTTIKFTWPKDGGKLNEDEPPTSATELSDYRKALRTAIATAYANGDGRFGKFYAEVCQPKIFTQKICGSIFEELVALSIGEGVDGAAATERIPVWDRDKAEAKPILKKFKKWRLDGDGVVEMAGEGVMAITEAKAYANGGGPSGSDITKMGQYYELIKGKIPGYVSQGEDDPKPVVFNHAAYNIAVPDPITNKQGQPEFPAPVKADLKKWMDELGKAFNEPATPISASAPANAAASYSAKTWSLHPPPDGSYEFKVKFNPELTYQLPATVRTVNLDNPAVKVPGLKVTQVHAAVDDTHKVTSGTVTYGIDAADLQKAPEAKKLTPLEGSTGGQVDNKLSGLTSKLKNFLPVDIDAAIVDDGVEATIKLKSGTHIPSLAGFTIDAETTEIKATYKGSGSLSLEAEVGIKHSSKDIKGSVKVEYYNGWGFTGKVTVGEGVIPGVSSFSAGVSKSPAGEWRIFADMFTVEKQFGQIKLTGTGSDLEYNVQTGMFKADLSLDADLGMFGKAAGTAKIENNKLTKGSLSYDTPELKYPAKSDAPALTGTVGGTINFNDGKFSGDIRGTANINIKGLQKVAGDKGLGLDVQAHVTEDGNYSGSISTKTDLQFGKHIVIPAPLMIKLNADGSVSGAFSIEVKNIKWIKDCKIKCTADKDGVHVEAFHTEIAFGSEEKNKFWGSITVDYTDDKGLAITGLVNYKIKEGMVATGKLTYDNQTHAVSLHLEVSEITLLDSKIDRKTLFKAEKKIPVVNIYGIGIYIDIGFDLSFDMGFKLGFKPELDFVGFSLETGEFQEIAAKLTLLGNLYAELIGTPRLGIGIFVLDPSLLSGGGGLKMPVVGRADINPKGVLELKYSPSGGVTGDAAFDMNMTFGIKASLVPYAEFDVLSGLWNPKWEGKALTEFTILEPKELFNLHVDFGGDMTKKTDPPATPGENAAPAASGNQNDEKFAQHDAEAAPVGDTSAPAPVKQANAPEGGEDGPFSLGGLLGQLKASVPEIATAEEIFNIAKKVWDAVSPIYDLVKPLFDLIGDRIAEVIDLFKTVPTSGDEILPWVWKLAKVLLHFAVGGLIDFVQAVWKMIDSAGKFIKKMVTKLVAEGQIGVKRHTYYIWRPWPMDDYNFMAAAEYKLNIPGLVDLGQHGPPGFLLTPSGAVALGLYEVLGACGVPITYAGESDIGEPYNDRWVGDGARG